MTLFLMGTALVGLAIGALLRRPSRRSPPRSPWCWSSPSRSCSGPRSGATRWRRPRPVPCRRSRPS
ncbi:hypothetical protein NKG05_09915 [Oerskovia sp. M15]